MAKHIEIDGKSLTLNDVKRISKQEIQVRLAKHSAKLIDDIRKKVEILAQGKEAIYGLNTGFGALAEKRIPKKDIETLQYNLIVSHAVGVGEPLTCEQARALMLLRANTLALGHSGCRSLLITNLLALLNADCAPFVPSKGSVGASGDLAPLAHLALLLLGKGKAYVKGSLTTAKEALATAGIKPITLQAKEGLALINGTQAMSALGSLALYDAEMLASLSDLAGACSIAALDGLLAPFDERIHAVRPHPGQIEVAKNLTQLLTNSLPTQRIMSHTRVQDAYSLRCIPQVHGATRDAITHVRSIFEREINSATDNPLVFLNNNTKASGITMLSGGNFHGQPLALSLDYLAMAVSELGNISERRIEQMVNPHLSGLPPFLAPNAGLNSGFMMLQVTASALVNENKVLCHPASTDSIPTSAGREDHVSMGMTSANKITRIIDNVYAILAIELMTACQGVDLRGIRLRGTLQKAYALVRSKVKTANWDRQFGKDLEAMLSLSRSKALHELF